MKVLLADDSDLILERLKEKLGTLKQVEIVASLKNGIEALETIRDLKPEVAIVDLKMPGLNGLEVLNEIRKEGHPVKFIILTFYSSDHYRHMAIQSGADYFFNKADDFDKVSDVIAELAGGKKNDNNLKIADLVEESSTNNQVFITTVENKKIKTSRIRNLLIVFLLAISSVVSATKYYVSNTGNDASNGTTTGTAWKTIAKVNASTFLAGDEILFLKGGVWREQLNISSSGSAGNPVTFSSYGTGNDPVITGANLVTGFANGGGGIWDKTGVTIEPKVVLINRELGTRAGSRAAINAVNNWYWTGNTLSVYSAGDPSGLIEAGYRQRVVDTQGKNHLTFTGITFECSNNEGSYMVYTCTASASELKFYNCTFQYSAGYGLQFNGTSSTTGCVVDGCIVRYNWRDGIYVQKDGDITINNCEVYSNGLKNTADHNGIFGWLGGVKITNCDIYDNGRWDILSHGIYQFLTSGPVLISNCTIHDQPHGSGVRLRGSGTITNSKIYNNSFSGFNLNTNEIYNVVYTINSNLIYGNTVYGIMQGGNKGTGNVSISVNNNTFYNNGTDAAIMIVPVVQDFVLRNNIIFNNASGGLILCIANSSTTTHSNNLYYKVGTGDINYIKRDGTYITKSNVINWEPTSVTGDPLFVNSESNWHLLTGSPAIGKGIAISAITKDLDGVTLRNPPDIGCYQSLASLTPPVYINSVLDETSPDIIDINYDLILADIVPAVSAFNVKVNSVTRLLTSVSISGESVKLTLATPVESGDITTLSYIKPATNPLQTVNGGQAESISSQLVTNNLITGIPPANDPGSSNIRITLYPNPVHHILNIMCEYTSAYSVEEAEATPNSIRIFELSGKLALERRLDPGCANQQIPVNLKTGVYVVLLVSGGLNYSSQKLIVYN